MALRASAFAPAHITGFFEICDTSKNPLKKGSRGSGLCLDLGVTTKVTIKDGDDVRIFLNGKPKNAPVTRYVVKALAPGREVVVKSRLDFPIGQGLGMSGAGALSTAVAIADALELPRNEAVEAAHRAEIRSGTGLGDVGPQSLGGMTIRLKPGIPPYGMVRSIPIDEEVEMVIGIVGKSVSTKSVITDPVWKRAINRAGRDSVNRISKRPTMENLFSLSRGFAERTGLLSRGTTRALKAVDRVGLGSMSMIGNSIFAHGGDTARVVRAVRPHVKKVMVCHIDNRGARII